MRAQGRGLFTGEHVCGRIPVFRSGTIGSAGNGSTVGAKKSPAGAGLSPNIRRSFMLRADCPQWNSMARLSRAARTVRGLFFRRPFGDLTRLTHGGIRYALWALGEANTREIDAEAAQGGCRWCGESTTAEGWMGEARGVTAMRHLFVSNINGLTHKI
jgi:hypothetical protein